MPERTADIIVGAGASASGQVNFSGLDPAQKRARIIEVLDRGLVGERMRVALPNDMYGEWVHNSPEEVYRMQAMGFHIDTEYATRRALHSEGDNKSIVGDTVFMVCSREIKDIIDGHRKEQFDRIHGKAKRGDKVEEKEFESSVRSTTPLGTINESRVDSVSLGEIAQSVQAGKNAST